MADAEARSAWAGMSGAVVFADQVVVGVVSEHHLPEGDNSLTVVPVAAIDSLPDANEWWRLLEVDRANFVRLPIQGGGTAARYALHVECRGQQTRPAGLGRRASA